MFTIGDFAQHGRVSIRMLRHYDALGLLRPARVDPAGGYRFYAAAQLARLNRIIALKDLGFTLRQVKSILDEEVGTEELRGMLRLRRAEPEEAVAVAGARPARVEARLRSIESEGHMPTDDVVVKSVPPVRVAELTATADSYQPEDIGPVIRPLYEELCRRLERAGIAPAGPGIRPPRFHGRGPAHRPGPDPLDRHQRPPLGRLRAGAVPGVSRGHRGVGDRTPGADRPGLIRPARRVPPALAAAGGTRRRPQPSTPVAWWGEPTGLDSGEPRCRR
ncbi:hypothetical protein GCM10010405_18520 [Streptomyces macrosporus]|uniref:HTH merR-type domain-containing protein n=1 Tax=Streptomyces macrosporus TaxID=44032 RepID=A0ABP5WX98_9ACTN